MYQVLKLGLHPYFSDRFTSYQTVHGYETRVQANESLTIPSFRSAKCQKSFLAVGTKFWNDLPLHVRNSSSLKIFKSNLRSHIFL